MLPRIAPEHVRGREASGEDGPATPRRRWDGSPGRRRIARIGAWAGGILAVWALLGFLAAPPLLRSVLEKRLAAALHRPVAIRELALNPFTFTATLRGVSVGQRSAPGTLLSFESLRVNAEAVSLLRRRPVIRELSLVSPRLTLVRYEDGTTNVSDLLQRPAKPEPAKEAPRFSVNNIRVSGGSIDFDDRPLRTKHEIRDLALGIPFLSNTSSDVEIFTEPSLSARVDGAPFALRGKTKPFSGSLETSVNLDLKDLDLPRYLGYLPAQLPVRLTAGRLDSKLTLSFTRSPGRPDALLLRGAVALRGASVLHGDKPLLSVRRLEARIASYDVFGGELRLGSVAAVSPELDLRRGRDGAFELVSAFKAGPPPAPRGDAETAPRGGSEAAHRMTKAPFNYEVSEIRVEDGTIRYTDASLGKPFRTTLSPVRIALRGLTSSGRMPMGLVVAARSDAGETLRHEGAFTLDPLSADGSVEVTGLPLGRYAPWYESSLAAELDGTADLAGRYRLALGPGGNTTFAGLTVRLHAVKARKRGDKKPFLAVPAAALDGGELDLDRRKLALGSLSAGGGFLAVRREADGAIDLAKLVGAGPAKPSAPWRLSVRRLEVENYRIEIDDLAAGKPAHLVLAPASVQLENFATSGPEHGNLTTRFVLNRRGLATATGPVGLSPVYADLRVRVRNLDLVPIEPYIFSQIRLSLVRGTLNGSGRLGFRPGPGGAASVTFAGSAVAKDAVAVEEESKEDFLRWDSVSVEKLRAGYNPVFVQAAKLDASGVVAHVGIAEDGTVNLLAILGRPPEKPDDNGGTDVLAGSEDAPAEPAPAGAAAPAAAPAPGSSPTPIRVDSVTLENSTIRLSDHLVKPNYSAELRNVGGRITGLSSEEGTKAALDLRGSLEGSSPLEISGTVNPLAATRLAAIRASFKDIDLVPMTPYFGKYAGYGVARGKLTMTVDYRLENRRLEAQNKFVVDQFSFGDKVESRRATKLPVKLAVALLKDRNGVIDLDLPISGSLDDPKFRIGRIVWKVLGNLLSKAITSPFTLLGKLFGGGAELGAVEFDPGRETLGQTARQRLDALSTALYERPALKLQAEGRADPATDSEGLKRVRFERKVRAQKMGELQKKGAAPASLDEVAVAPEEWPDLLKKAYKKEKFKKPRTALGFAKDLPPAEMEKLMVENLQVAPEDLRQLALSRARAVQAYLLAGGKVGADRIFLVEPGTTPAESKGGARPSRVDFTLK